MMETVTLSRSLRTGTDHFVKSAYRLDERS